MRDSFEMKCLLNSAPNNIGNVRLRQNPISIANKVESFLPIKSCAEQDARKVIKKQVKLVDLITQRIALQKVSQPIKTGEATAQCTSIFECPKLTNVDSVTRENIRKSAA